MKTLPVYSVKERRPENNECIILIGDRLSFGMTYAELPITVVEYSWSVLDDDGTDSGDQVLFKSLDDVKDNDEKMRLMLFDTNNAQEISEDSLYICFDNLKKLYKS